MPGAVEVLLHQDLRHVVADLRAEHGDRVAGRRLAPRTRAPSSRRAAFASARRSCAPSDVVGRGARRAERRRRPARTRPSPGRAAPARASRTRARSAYGKRLLSTVVGASGSFFERKSRPRARGPRLRPKRFSNACSTSADSHLARRRPCRRCRRSATPSAITSVPLPVLGRLAERGVLGRQLASGRRAPRRCRR